MKFRWLVACSLLIAACSDESSRVEPSAPDASETADAGSDCRAMPSSTGCESIDASADPSVDTSFEPPVDGASLDAPADSICYPGADAWTGKPPSNCPNDLPPDDDCPAASPAYDSDIAPIAQRRCATCHALGGIEPVRLFDTYDQVFRQRREMLTQIYACKMPPVCATPLTQGERQTVLKWLSCGALRSADAGAIAITLPQP